MAEQVPAQARSLRRIGSLVASLVMAALLLVLVAEWGSIDLWPDVLVLPHPELLIAACLVQIPYVWIRAMRLRFVLDPRVAEVSGDPKRRLDPRVLQGSGWVSFPIVMLLPFRLGELSRPLLLTRSGEPGIGLAESVSAIAVERVVDGLMVVGMLFFGLAFAEVLGDGGESIAYVRGFGRLMALTFLVGLLVLIGAAARPDLIERSVVWVLPGKLGRRAAAAALRIAGTIALLFDWRRGLPFVLSSLAYWSTTVGQLWLVLRACGLELGPAEAAAIVSIVGLGIQLPGGPAQAGSFQFGMAVALGMLTRPDQTGAASSFAALMYVLQVAGSIVMALPGLLLLARARSGREAKAAESAEHPSERPSDDNRGAADP